MANSIDFYESFKIFVIFPITNIIRNLSNYNISNSHLKHKLIIYK